MKTPGRKELDDAIGAALVGRRIVSATTAGETYSDGGESTDEIMLTLDDGQKVHFRGDWRNDSTADVYWEVDP